MQHGDNITTVENYGTLLKMARPLKFETVEVLQLEIDNYFTNTPQDEWTITGLALALDTSRQTLVNYEEKDEFIDAIKKAKLKVENGYEKDLKKHGRSGTIFALKNFDWKDKSETDITSGGKVIPIYGGLSGHNSNQEDIQPEEEN